ncbi:MAG: galactokinase [Lachnospiraceae bacterium]|nr:galactokinase [Lachnospiraceae bacterium]
MDNAGDVKNRVLEVFAEKYGSSEGARVFFAPGRVNLIGEHTDYNGGHVFPCALNIGTYAAVRVRDDKTANFYSMNFKEEGIISLDLDKELKPSDDLKWVNYPAGIIWAFAEKKMTVPAGFDVVLYGNIPNGSGLSSSASVEVLTGFILKSLFGFEVSNIDLAKIGQYSENRFNGVNCGIMDQFAIAMGRKDHAIFLDTATLQYEYVPIKLTGCKLVIACSNKKRGLGDSKYNERRAECETALSEIRTLVDVQSLGELDEATFGKVEMLIKDDVRIKRARHAVYENRRTITAVQALKRENITLFGQLMNASHESLRDDYEVTGPELDALVDAARKQPGVIGSRMTGAGFGGCTVSIVKDECVDSFIEKVGAEYLEKIGYAADFYVVEIGDGPAEIL